jgi:iron complex outermembrane receptor protein/vitamin B12 transporter
MRVRAFVVLFLCTTALSSARPAAAQFTQTVVVTASATPTPEAQTGAPVSVIDSRTIGLLNQPDVLDALRVVPGVQIVQTGARGGPTSLFIRGGNANFNTVLVDGVPVNDIGGAFDFAQLALTGIDRIEVLRQTNSVMYGSDALAGVVAMSTRRGMTRRPDVAYAIDGGNLGTFSTVGSVGGVVRRFDYFSALSHDQTDNDVPNSAYRNATYAGRFGVALGGHTDVSGTLRHVRTVAGAPNAFGLYGVADDSSQRTRATDASITAESQVTNRWQTVVRFGSVDETLHNVNPSPTSSRVVTIRGANGYSATGQAILDFDGSYPSRFDSRTTRRMLRGETSYVLSPAVTIAGGARYEREEGFSDPDAAPDATRNNGGAFVEGRVALRGRHFVTAGVGVEHNAAFGGAATPRLSLASFVHQSASGNTTRIVLNAGTGIKAPSVFQQQSALGSLGPERSRSVDAGVEQAFADGRGRARVSYFHNTFDDLIEFLPKTVLPQAGVPVDVANATAFGAYVNSQSYRAHGLESVVDVRARRDLQVTASYTWLDAEVTQAFSASASFNPLFPGVPIGAFSPLVGARPFRRPANGGSLMVLYTPGRAEMAVTADFVGKRDDSTFLTDTSFGNTMLLPNGDLDAAYQKVDVSGSYALHRRLRLYVVVSNLLNQQYDAVFGYPSLPIAARAGVRVRLGGE